MSDEVAAPTTGVMSAVADPPTEAPPAATPADAAEALAPPPPKQQASEKPWLEQVSENLRDNEFLTAFNDVNSLAQGALELKMRADSLSTGQEGMIKIPDANSSESERHSFWERLGRPSHWQDYTYEVTDIAAGVEADQGFVDWAKKNLYAIGASNNAFRHMIREYTQLQATQKREQMAQRDRATQEAIDRLKSEWKDAYAGNVNVAKAGFKAFADDDFMQAITDAGLADHPGLMKMFYRVGAKIGEDSIRTGTPPPAERPEDRAYPNSQDMYNRAQQRAQQRAERVRQRFEREPIQR